MGRYRQPLPEVPLHLLSPQQRLVYKLSAGHGTREIAQILAIPEKQVRQVYSAIRSKAGEFANKKVSPAAGAEPVHGAPRESGTHPCNYDFIRELAENNGVLNLTASEIFVLEHAGRGASTREISRLTGKSVQSVRKTHRRARKKLYQNYGFHDDNCITKIDTGNTYVTINRSLIASAMGKWNLTRDEICRKTGILPERMVEIESNGNVSYDELFLLVKHLRINPYGPPEKERILEKLSDPNWIREIRANSLDCGCRPGTKNFRERINRDKSRYRNRVMYYGTARFRHLGGGPDGPVVEEGRNGLFPLALTRRQQAECGWILKRMMIRPAYTYRHPGLAREIHSLERKLAEEKDQSRADRYRRELLYLKEDVVPEDGKSIFIVDKERLSEISKTLFDS